MRIGIIGAGKLGIVLAQLATRAGYEVALSGSGSADKIRLSVKVLAPGALAMTVAEVCAWADMVILALPLSKFRSLPAGPLNGKIVVDATNYWDEVDGPRSDTLPDAQSSSEAIQAYLSGAHVVKALSHMGYHELYDYAQLSGAAERKAVAIAGNNPEAVERVATFVASLGFTPVVIGPLSAGKILEPGNRGFGLVASESVLRAKLLKA